jgi:hypothetical protein
MMLPEISDVSEKEVAVAMSATPSRSNRTVVLTGWGVLAK